MSSALLHVPLHSYIGGSGDISAAMGRYGIVCHASHVMCVWSEYKTEFHSERYIIANIHSSYMHVPRNSHISSLHEFGSLQWDQQSLQV